MLKFWRFLIGIFSPYVDSFERKVDKFFKSIKSTDNILNIRDRLLDLMQQNLICVNVWLEKKYKGYLYLNKKTRRKMYEDVKKIALLFDSERQKNVMDHKAIKKLLDDQDLPFPVGDEEKIKYLADIMFFLQPAKHYFYIKTASFGKLLRDPENEKLEGDCNQIVTLYAYLYSLKYPLRDLQIKLLPGHVCLHFRGIDIEATNATFHKYKENKQVLPITEIISTNLLDLADFREEAVQISPRDILKSAQLAYAISSLKELVTKNLTVAYRNLGIVSLKGNDFETAIFYLEKTGDPELLRQAMTQAAVHFMNADNFEKAKFYANKVGEEKLKKTVQINEWAKEYNKLAAQVSGVATLAQAKAKKHVYVKMLEIAQKLQNEKLKKSVAETLSKI